jgi:hypothetical protein
MKWISERNVLYEKYYCKVEFIEQMVCPVRTWHCAVLHGIRKLFIINVSTQTVNKLHVASRDKTIIEQ